jgi:hypothetical protein
MTEPLMPPLSPTAQSILDAAEQVPVVLNYAQDIPAIIVAVLYKLADIIHPGLNPLDDSDAAAGVHAAHESMHDYLLILAEELHELS